MYKTAVTLAIAFAAVATPATAQVVTYTNQSSFGAATTNATTNGFTFTGNTYLSGPYTAGPVTFSTNTSDTLIGYNDAYGVPYISDNNYDNSGSNTFTISSTGTALGLLLGSYNGAATYSYLVNGVGGTISLPSRNATTFLGFTSMSGPISATFTVLDGVGANSELDVTSFITASAVSGAVPEPATWAMMLLGFGGIGIALRRKRTPALAAA